jgi:hypothetical protein
VLREKTLNPQEKGRMIRKNEISPDKNEAAKLWMYLVYFLWYIRSFLN